MMDIWGRKPLFTFTLLLSGTYLWIHEGNTEEEKNDHVVF
jgi:hypothetical protein